ncbi:MAG: GDSL-type esterase/lipase family protein, partial [Planctomycetes bacterium]|nr:GDSL-type esterase/lipase family protein [Planctomycetota bacterium]
MRRAHAILLLLLLSLAPAVAAEGDDVAAAFARARSSGVLRAAAIGGSITQGGEGWIAPWLRQRLPGALVSMRNAGWSGTGSELGTFRLARDVIAADPDLVLIETAVNDGGLSDDEAVRNVESLVVRLAALPRRPGLVMVLAAARGGAKHARHRAVAAHYGLLCVDLQAAMAGRTWEDFFTDDVHLKPAGNALYAATIAAALAPLVDRPAPAALPPLPAPLARLPLRLDGRLWTPGPAPGWTMRTQVGEWWDCFLLGSAEGRDPAQPLVVPVRGTAVGLHVDFGNGKECGTLLASVDGGLPVEVPGHLRGGGEALVLAKDLPPGEHRLSVTVASWRPGPVRVAYVLAGGAGDAPAPAQGPWTAARLAALRLDPVPGDAFRIAGPVGGFTADVDDPAALFAAPPLPQDAAAYRAASVPGPAGAVAV